MLPYSFASLNEEKIGTINNGKIDLLADQAEISTLNKGSIKEMLGTSLISANIGGVINKNGARTLILYTPEMSKKRRADFEKIKEEKLSLKHEFLNQVFSSKDLSEEIKNKIAYAGIQALRGEDITI